MDILRVTWQVPRGYIGQGRLDKGTGVWTAPDKGKMPYLLAQGRAMPVPGSSTSQHMVHSRGVDQTVFEGIFRKQSLFWPVSSCQVRRGHIMK